MHTSGVLSRLTKEGHWDTQNQSTKGSMKAVLCLCCSQTKSQCWLIDIWQTDKTHKTVCKTVNSEPSFWKRYGFLAPYTEQELLLVLGFTHQANLCQGGDGRKSWTSRNGHVVSGCRNQGWVSSVRFAELCSFTGSDWKSKLSRLVLSPHILRSVDLDTDCQILALRASGDFAADISLAGRAVQGNGNRSSDNIKRNSLLACLLYFSVQNHSVLNWIFPAQSNKPNL